MARPFRIEYEGAIYHITSRGNEKRDIFLADKDREHFVGLLREGADFFRVEIIAYCLMSNHYHLLLQTKQANLSRFMQRLNTTYTIYFNFKYDRVGHLFQGRYKGILVGSQEYYLSLSRYIHLNPVKVKRFIKNTDEEKKQILNRYGWSSYQGVLDPQKRPGYFRLERILDEFGGDTSANRKKYEKYIEQGITSKVDNPMEEVKYQLLLGGESFIERMCGKYILKKKDDFKEYNPEIRASEKIKPVNELADIAAKEYGINAEELLKPKSAHKEARKLLVSISYELNVRNKTLRELGRELGGLSGPGVMRVHERLQKNLEEDKNLRERYARIKKMSIV